MQNYFFKLTFISHFWYCIEMGNSLLILIKQLIAFNHPAQFWNTIFTIA